MRQLSRLVAIAATAAAMTLAGSGGASIAQQTGGTTDDCAAARADLQIVMSTQSIAVVEAYLASTPERCLVQIAAANERLDDLHRRDAAIAAAEAEAAERQAAIDRMVSDARSAGFAGRWCNEKGRATMTSRIDSGGSICTHFIGLSGYDELCGRLLSVDARNKSLTYDNGGTTGRMWMINGRLKMNGADPDRRC